MTHVAGFDGWPCTFEIWMERAPSSRSRLSRTELTRNRVNRSSSEQVIHPFPRIGLWSSQWELRMLCPGCCCLVDDGSGKMSDINSGKGQLSHCVNPPKRGWNFLLFLSYIRWIDCTCEGKRAIINVTGSVCGQLFWSTFSLGILRYLDLDTIWTKVSNTGNETKFQLPL